MLKLNRKSTRGACNRILLTLATVVATALSVNRLEATQSPTGCTANNFTINISKNHNNITNGTVVTYVITVENLPDTTTCDITLGAAGLVFVCPGPDGTPATGTTNVLIAGGTTLPGGTTGFGPVSFTNQCTININPGVKTAQVLVTAPGALLHDNPLTDDPANINKTLSVNVFTPCIEVTKQCAQTCTLYGQPIGFTGTITNCGDIALIDVGLVDDQAGLILGPTNTLAVGGTLSFSGSYTPSGNLCGPFTDTVTASGTAPLDTPVGVTNTASATCPVCNNPCVQVTKVCPSITTVNLSAPSYTVTGSVTNCGNVPLSNVVVTDNITNADGTHFTVTVTNISSLPIGASVELPPQTITPTTCGPSTDQFTVTAQDLCPGQTVPPAASQICTVTVVSTPCLAVTKICPNTTTVNLSSPAYTVSGFVTNCGTATMTNVVVTDTITNANGTHTTVVITNISSLAAGASVALPPQTITPTTCGPSTDIFGVSGTDVCGNAATANSQICTVTVVSTPCLAVTKICPSTTTVNLSAPAYTVSGFVTNCGTATMTNVVVTDTITNADGTHSSVIITNISSLAAGASVALPPQTITPTLCGPSTDVFGVSGTDVCGNAATANSQICTVTVVSTPCLAVTKVCPSSTSVNLTSSSYVVSGFVTNCGTATMTNVVVTDTITNADGTHSTVIITNISSLAAGASVALPPQTITPTTCGPSSDIFGVSGTDVCGNAATANSQICTVTVVSTPCLAVTKICPSTTTVNLSAPAYMVSGFVTNCGTATMTNVVVTDTITNADGTHSTVIITNISSLAAGASVALPPQTITPTLCGPSTDVFGVSGTDVCGNAATANSQICTVTVVSTPCLAVTKICPTSTSVNLTSPGYTVSGFVTNCGTATMTNIVVTDEIIDANGIKTTVTITNISSLAAGASVALPPQTITPTTCGPSKDTFSVSGTDVCGNSATANSATCTVTVVSTPCLAVTKICPSTATVNLSAPAYTVSGFVTNCGTATMTNVVVTDTITNADGTFTTVVVTNISSLAAGASVALPPQTITPTLCGPSTDIFGVSGTDVCGNAATANSQVCTVTVISTPCLAVTKICPSTTSINLSGSYTVSGFVTNCGTATMTNVVVTDIITNANGTTSSVTVTNISSLPAGASVALPTQTITPTDCGPSIDLFQVSGTDVCGNAATANSSICTVTVVCPKPCIEVTKLIACGTAGPNPQCNGQLTYGPTATGVAGTNNPAFCYKIFVTNCGNVALTNIQVSDPVLNLSTTIPFLDANSVSAPIFAGTSWPVGTHTNTVTATGQSQVNGQSTNATASAVAIVLPASVSCNLSLTNDFNLNTNGSGSCLLTLPTGSSNTPVQVTLTVNNNGQADLNVNIIGGDILTSALVQCSDDVTPVTFGSIFVPAGQSTNFVLGCVLVTCPGTNISVEVQGTAMATASTGVQCVYDTRGSNITTAASSCQQCVNCLAPVTCRVTGGGTLYSNTFSTNCIVVATTLYDDLADSAGLILDHISHGGQLGAPFSHMDCATRLGDPCIRGQWQHVRHYDNGANGNGNQPQDVFDMTFHSNTPKGVFDTLDCACLPCCGGPAKQPNGNFFGIDNHFQVCNPDDHRVCGPLPAPAPANAIIFSGIGTFTPATNNANGRAAASRYVVFRVYIEDRSEPGGVHPGGAIMPATVYCFQAWDTGIATTKKPDFSTIATAFRTELSADSCAFLSSMSKGSLPQGSLPSTTVSSVAADVVDCGPLHDGSQQIHPATGATCTSP